MELFLVEAQEELKAMGDVEDGAVAGAALGTGAAGHAGSGPSVRDALGQVLHGA